MKAAAVSRTTKAIASLHHAQALYHAFLKPFLHAPSCAERSASRPGSTYIMLVASDVQRGMGGILP